VTTITYRGKRLRVDRELGKVHLCAFCRKRRVAVWADVDTAFLGPEWMQDFPSYDARPLYLCDVHATNEHIQFIAQKLRGEIPE